MRVFNNQFPLHPLQQSSDNCKSILGNTQQLKCSTEKYLCEIKFNEKSKYYVCKSWLLDSTLER